MANFREELTDLLNRMSMEGESDTPDFILAKFLDESLQVFNNAVERRTVWYQRKKKRSQ